MKPISGIVNSISELIGQLTLPTREKKELEIGLLTQARAVTVQEEVKGNWLQRSWRPLVMLTFASVILIGTFTSLPILAETSRFWDLLEIGLGGYVVGRSGEKIMQAFARKPR